MTQSIRRVDERAAGLEAPLLVHPEWQDAFPWLIQGTTWRGVEGDEFDLGLSGATPVGAALDRWRRLMRALGTDAIAHSRQVHGDSIRLHESVTDGIRISDGSDGHHTDRPGLVLTVSIADCIPVFIVNERVRSVTLLHAGWRGVAAGIVERGVTMAAGMSPEDLHVHLGPAICGECYEVGTEVFERLGLPVPDRPTPVDLKDTAARRAAGAGAHAVTVSGLCTRCDPERRLFSHRGGDRGRQMAVIGIRRPQ